MSKRLPSLTSLRTFEAAARNLSFAKAADELFVTPAAVGFQIKQLEAELGVTLFMRKHRAVELTERGRQLLANLGSVFETIQTAWDAAHEPMPVKTLKISGPAKAVHSWVMPALSKAENPLPNLRISWDLSKQKRDIASGEVDLAIRWALEPEGDLHWEPLLRTWFTPLMRPDVARFVHKPVDLSKQGLIGVEFALDTGMEDTTWAPWFRINGLEPPRDFAVSCADTASAVDTAIATGYVAIAGSFLSSEQLVKGSLVAPFDTAIAPFSRFWLVCRKGLDTTEEFRWILNAMRRGEEEIDRQASRMHFFHPDGTPIQS
ncbi:LysR family transcriptional regulator [Nioella aestuarii]|uniref:LysR family transcriptional regulator n=1 Tax=Nioella aestuarii TaxID=1662864 RepID=UPI003D7F58CA